MFNQAKYLLNLAIFQTKIMSYCRVSIVCHMLTALAVKMNLKP